MISPMTPASKLRVARPTEDLAALIPFYRDELGFCALGRFQDSGLCYAKRG
jgi:hypothetical protein